MHRRGASRFCRNLLSHRTETKSFVKEPFCFPEIFWYRKKFMDKRGHITISSRNFYVSQCRKISWACPKCFRKFRVSKNFMHTRGYHVFPSKFFLSHSAENIRRGIFWCFTNFWSRKILDKRRGSITIFRRSFCLTVLNYFIGEHFGASEKFFHRKFSCIGGGHHGFVGTFCLTGPKRKAL